MSDRIPVSVADLTAALTDRCVAIRDADGIRVITGEMVGPRVVADALWHALSANAAHREPVATGFTANDLERVLTGFVVDVDQDGRVTDPGMTASRLHVLLTPDPEPKRPSYSDVSSGDPEVEAIDTFAALMARLEADGEPGAVTRVMRYCAERWLS